MLRPFLILVLPFAVALVVVAACDAGGIAAPPAPTPCTASSDCPSSMVCEFSATAGCSAQGQCGVVVDSGPCAPQAICLCGTAQSEATTCIVGGYVLAPVRSVGACPGSGETADAGGDAGNDAGTDASGD